MAAAMPTARPAAGNIQEHRPMNHDGEGSDVVAANRGVATIRLWQTPSRVWPAYPTVAVIRAASRLGRGRAERRSPAIGGVTVFLDDSKAGSISPGQIKAYQVSPGEHSLSIHFLGGLRRSRKLHVPLAEGEEKQFVCLLNGWAWPSVRPATAEDVAAMERWQSPAVDASDLAADNPISSECQLGRSRRVRGC
jgi:hypothetical protein